MPKKTLWVPTSATLSTEQPSTARASPSPGRPPVSIHGPHPSKR
nr:hypothetical protein [Novosphingobium decolorationis]